MEGAFLKNGPGSVGVYNRNLADHPTNQGSVGVYNKNLADHPAN